MKLINWLNEKKLSENKTSVLQKIQNLILKTKKEEENVFIDITSKIDYEMPNENEIINWLVDISNSLDSWFEEINNSDDFIPDIFYNIIWPIIANSPINIMPEYSFHHSLSWDADYFRWATEKLEYFEDEKWIFITKDVHIYEFSVWFSFDVFINCLNQFSDYSKEKKDYIEKKISYIYNQINKIINKWEKCSFEIYWNKYDLVKYNNYFFDIQEEDLYFPFVKLVLWFSFTMWDWTNIHWKRKVIRLKDINDIKNISSN